MKEYIFNVHDVVLLMTAAECVLLAIFQQVLPIRERNYGLLLTAFLLIVATASACTLLLWNDQIEVAPLFGRSLLPYFLLTAIMLKGPAIYLYVSALTQQHLRLHRHHALHLIPAMAVALWVFVFDLSSDDLRRLTENHPDFPKLAVDLVWDLSTAVPLAYAAAAVLLLRRYRGQLEDEYSHFSTTELHWLNILTYGVLVSWSWTLLVHILAKYTSVETADQLGIADNYVTFILINAFFAYSLSYAHQLLATQPQQSREPNEEKPSDSAITKVRQAMEVEKLYLKKNLNLEQFSNSVELSAKEVSNVINKHFGTNFFEFINSYRIEEAKALLANPDKKDMTVLDVLMESGFNSKSAFHRFFSRLVGMSPTEYRKQALNKNKAVST
ncbi:helix-turn-helix domain-containing protein [Microbulbifer thermotolerans]|uniref:AraC family transcriptional regulator n=1 Tax=Microbulbifer thermotolerans TaxID=252514 RepID=A0A143HS15_MICTH|nr:helix-turn-helix domain-containing protein [Microbulbifer thermotolerans]AMX04267.1 AraC family transcriptional regulator [Microbulbifer thermotolerans]MCX2783716.1 helix-turn-helix domain-containing protein [Microbulbifer thermotolerans]MCX2795362.1 helix-turn-helix domain-containing protein [Microbulbifer thermotolerans]MCX2802434.1 helix-turn-helix domain-containing protein [Microbulbifer thermotolerans]MCX2806180.1 helix-turn-helix domain-containing protein [Microbulbifer thermotolerans